MQTHIVTPHLNRLTEMVQMRGHKVCLNGKIRKIISKLSLLPLLIWSTGPLNADVDFDHPLILQG